MKLSRSRGSESGFSLTELIIVVGIIGILIAVAVPAIGSYIRTYKIRGAIQEVSTALADARAKAISKTTNFGVIFIILDANSPGNTTGQVAYLWVLEDDVNGGAGVRQTTTALLNNPAQLGPIHYLPLGINFSNPQAGGNNNRGLRFNRLGAMCNPGSTPGEPCPALDAGTNYLYWDAANQRALVTITQPQTTLKAQISVLPGGRIQVTRSWTVS